jgi:hypothetical protein
MFSGAPVGMIVFCDELAASRREKGRAIHPRYGVPVILSGLAAP